MALTGGEWRPSSATRRDQNPFTINVSKIVNWGHNSPPKPVDDANEPYIKSMSEPAYENAEVYAHGLTATWHTAI